MDFDFLAIPLEILDLAMLAEQDAKPVFSHVEAVEEYNSMKVLNAFIKNSVSTAHLNGTTGYGYGDIGRDTLERVFADIVGSEDALVRHSFVSGTHALTVGLFGVLRTGDCMLSLTGKPYDTLEEVIGLKKTTVNQGSLKDFGINYKQIELKDGKIDISEAKKLINKVTVAYIQRSRGYSLRPSLSVEDIGEACRILKETNPNVIILVDNCYGEFVEKTEPTQHGADLIIGSLIKNPGGGIAKTGGYIAGRKDLIELCAFRLTTPGTGKEVGCSLDELRSMYLGLFMAPTVVAAALKTAVFAAALIERMGYTAIPRYNEPRFDIIQSLCLKTPQALCSFCKGIQNGSPIDSFATPEPWDMPGYDSQVIMAAGAFTMGASIELSADGPMREPYAVWLQGGLTYPSGKAGVMMGCARLLEGRG